MIQFIIVIDTDKYAGNFERQMGSYITAQEEEYHGQPWADLGKEGISPELFDYFDSKLNYVSIDNEHYHTFVHIAPNPDWVNNGNGKEVRKDSKSARLFKKQYPAYRSVAIYVSEKPTREMFEEIKKRAEQFTKLSNLKEEFVDQDINIDGFRVLKEENIKTLVELD